MSTQKCSNCGKEIPLNILILHQRFCDKNTRKCSICDEPIQIDEYEEHKNKFHLKVQCAFCGKEMSEKLLNEHKKTCSDKFVNCKYCDLALSLELLNDHEYICGSKTEECPYCNILVPKCEYDLHLKYICKKNENNIEIHEKSVDEILMNCLIKNNEKISYVEEKKSNDDINKENKKINKEEVIYINDDKEEENKGENKEEKDNNIDNDNNVNNPEEKVEIIELGKNKLKNENSKIDKNIKPVKYHKKGKKKVKKL